MLEALVLDGAGFHVDVEVLEEAAGSIRLAVRDQNGRELSAVPGAAEEYGNEDVASAVSDFCERWSDAVDELVDGGHEMVDALSSSVAAYREADAAAEAALKVDPAVDEADG